MNAVDYKQELVGWCGQNSDFQLGSDQAQGGAAWTQAVTVKLAGGNSAPVEILQENGDSRIMIRSNAVATSSATGKLQELIDQRPGWVRATTQPNGSQTAVSLHTYIWPDGWNQHNCFASIYEIAQTRHLFDKAFGVREQAQATSGWNAVSPSQNPAAAATPSYTAQQPTGATPVTSTQPVAMPTMPAAGAFTPTHTVPPQGMQSWAAPDPAGPIVAHLAGGLPIQVAETRGAWARVICSNGWTGWVDGRIIGVTS